MIQINNIIKQRLSENKNYKLRYNPDKWSFPASSYISNLLIYRYYSLLYKSLYFLDKSILFNEKIYLYKSIPF